MNACPARIAAIIAGVESSVANTTVVGLPIDPCWSSGCIGRGFSLPPVPVSRQPLSNSLFQNGTSEIPDFTLPPFTASTAVSSLISTPEVGVHPQPMQISPLGAEG